MKTAGIALLFGLCTLLGARLAARKSKRLTAVRALKHGLGRFSERIAQGETLKHLASEDGLFFSLLHAYLSALERGRPETEAAETACAALGGYLTERDAMRAFLDALSNASHTDLLRRIEALRAVLDRAETEAGTEAKQARVIRVSGVLVGAGLAIVLL